jgi:hypothetical protein
VSTKAYHEYRGQQQFVRFDFGVTEAFPQGTNYIEVQVVGSHTERTPVTISSDLTIEKEDDDWYWDRRDEWNIAVDQLLSTLLTVLTHNPQLLDLERPDSSTADMFTDLFDTLGNQF